MKRLSLFYIALSGILWGTSVIFFNLLTPFGFSSLDLTFLRALVAAIVMVIYAFIADRSLFKISIKELVLFALSGVSVFGTASCYFTSMSLTSASTAVVLMYTAPIFVMIYSVMFLSEKMTKTKCVCVILMILGCTFVSGILNGFKFNISGILIGIVSGISYSLHNILTRIEMMKQYNSTKASLYAFIFFAISSFFVSDCQNTFFVAAKNPVVITLAIFMGICTSFLPYFFYTKALKVIPAGTATSLGIIEPMSATLFSVFIFGEILSFMSVIGIGLILISVFVLSKENE